MEPAATFDVAARTPQTSRPRRADKEPRPDRWYILGRAYDLGSFAHPGGNDALRIGLGRDATYLVMGHHLAEPRALLRMLAPFARPTDSDWDPHGTYATAASRDAVLDDAVLRSSKEVLRSYKAEVGRLDAPPLVFALAALFAVAEFAGIALWRRGSVWGGCGAAVASWLCALNLSHDASHGAVRSRAPRVNAAAQYLALPFHWGPEAWKLQHVYSHHSHTNGEGDPDAGYLRPFCRIDRERDPESWRNGRWIARLLLLMVGASASEVLLFPLRLAFVALTGRLPSGDRGLGLVPNATNAGKAAAFRALLEAFVALGAMLWPLFQSGASWPLRVALCLAPWLTSSLVFALVTQSSHLTQPCLDVGARLQGVPGAWGRLQVLSSINYACDSRIWAWITGGLNLQSVHHVAPHVHSWHYPLLYPRLRLAWTRLGCVPSEAPSLAAAFGAHVKQVSRANADESGTQEPQRASSKYGER